MKNIKNILALVLALVMVLCLCACAGDADEQGNGTTNTTANTTETTEKVDDGKVTYTVKVVDEGGNPVVGAMVQLCLEACVPGKTNDQGIATYDLAEADYKVSFISIPAGYTAEQTEYHFAAGAYELTITLKAAA